jgi:hypothetical protein
LYVFGHDFSRSLDFGCDSISASVHVRVHRNMLDHHVAVALLPNRPFLFLLVVSPIECVCLCVCVCVCVGVRVFTKPSAGRLSGVGVSA